MNKYIQIFFLATVMLFAACSKNQTTEPVTPDYLIFGHFYGQCIGESCIETYKLEDQKLYEDLNDNYSLKQKYRFEELNNELFLEVKDLPDFLPQELLSMNDSTFGCPDCADQGGLKVEFSIDGISKTFRIDQSKSQVPEYLHGFMDKINEKISLINK